ncbi:MAG: hypothetical protein AABX25_01855 [Nanoarchaeota archaeon]
MKRFIIPTFVVFLLVFPSVSAAIFDRITGRATEEIITEEVKCVFKDTKLEQGCYSTDSQFRCSGMDSCTANVSGKKGQKLKWKSSCEDREITTKIDGIHEIVEFKCKEKYEFLRTAPLQLMLFKEQVKCIFANSDSEQKCYSDDNRFSCSGAGSCIADIAAPGYGMRIIWKSTCGGFSYTFLNQTNKTIEFNCQGIKDPYVYEIIEEEVKCIFANSSSQHSCNPFMGKVSCSGAEECTVRVSEEKGKMLEWHSSCDRYDYLFRPIQYTVMDGNPEEVKFICRPLPNIILNSGKVYAYLFYRGECNKDCKKIEKALLKYKEKYPQLEVKTFDMAIPENAELFSNIFFNRGHGPEYLPVLFMAGAISSSMRYDKRYMEGTDMFGMDSRIQNCIEQGTCPKPFRSEQEIFVEKNYERYIRQGVWCLFDDPELVERCTENFDIPECSNIVRECYTENNEFGCKWDGGIVAAEDGRKYAYCIAMTAAPENVTTKLKWKSSCEGSAETVIDVMQDYIEFKCAPSTNVTPEDISGKGFLHAYWECYDGTEQKSAEGAGVCKTSEEWKMEAKEFCRYKCHKTSNFLCGINQFSVSGECYPEPKEEPVPAPIEEEFEKEQIEKGKEKEEQIKKEITKEPEKPEEKEEFLFCKDSCPFEGKCYPFGHRQGEKYCSDEGVFVFQLEEDSICDNNFECSTNVCVDGKCVSSNVIQKIIDWLKRLFG